MLALIFNDNLSSTPQSSGGVLKLTSRRSAVNLGYLSDPFLPLLYRPPLSSSTAGPSRKPPLINVGTHHRTIAMDMLVERFLEAGGMQILSLGAGTDTRFWRLMSSDRARGLKRYVEVDFPHQTSQKAQRIARSPKLSALLSNAPAAIPASKPYTILGGGTALTSDRYSLIPLDLRDPSTLAALNDQLDPDIPTLLLAECVFCYMKPEEADAVLKWFGRFRDAAVVVYEMIGLEDQFGRVMRRNLAARNLNLPGAVFRTPAEQAARFVSPALANAKFDESGAKTLWEIRSTTIPPEEIQRISSLEHLDEIEELKLVLDHYCVAWATRGDVLHGIHI